MFLFKKIVSQFFFPMPLCLGLCFIGLVLLWWTRKQRAGKWLVTSGLLLLTALSYGSVSNALLLPLEQKYPAYVKRQGGAVKFVVVLGGGHRSEPSFPLTSQLSDQSLKRLAEGIRIQRENPESQLILSGGTWRDPVSNAKLMADVAFQLGVSANDIQTETDSKDTEDQARLIAPMVATNQFVLVTSASHMPRSMELFEEQGLHPEPAPTEHLATREQIEFSRFFPNSGSLRRSEAVFYERMGSFWHALTRKAGH